LADIPENIKQNLDIRAVHWIDEVLAAALQYLPTPAPNSEAEDNGKAELDAVKIKNQGLTAH
jgi:ATP-dependent Lon protease